jgi:hypothetical protein
MISHGGNTITPGGTGSAIGFNGATSLATWIGNSGDTYNLPACASPCFYGLATGDKFIADGLSATWTCTGTVTASQTDGLYNHSAALNGTACATATGDSFIAQRSGTAYLVIATASAGGIAGDAVTAYKNGAAQTVSAIIGTGTYAFDGNHTFTFVAGDRIGCQAITGAADTLANPSCTIYWF